MASISLLSLRFRLGKEKIYSSLISFCLPEYVVKMNWSTMLRINGKHFTLLGMYFWTTHCTQVAYLVEACWYFCAKTNPLSYLYEFTNKMMEIYAQQMKNDVTSLGFCPGKYYFCIRDHPFKTSANFMQFLTPPPLHWQFLLLSIGKLDQFLTPPP